MRKCMEEFEYLLKSRAPCIWVETYEEAAFLTDLVSLVAKSFAHYSLFSFSHTKGLEKIPLLSGESKNEPEPITLEGFFKRLYNDHNADENNKAYNMYVFHDFHLLNDGHVFKRSLRDSKEYATKNYVPLIIVSPIVNIPIEHEKLFSVFKYDLLSYSEIEDLHNMMYASIEKAKEKNLSLDISLPTEEEKTRLIKACLGLTYNEICFIMKYSLKKFNALKLEAIMDQKIQLVRKSGVLDYKIPNVSLDEIGGNCEFKTWIDELEMAMSEDAANFGCYKPKGYIGIGVPGTSKTLMAEALATKMGVPFIIFNASKIYNKFVGDSEKKIEQAFHVIKSCAPCVLLIDEVEKVLGGVKSSNSSELKCA